MKQIKRRRRRLRIGDPVGFSLFCLGCLAVLALLYVGVSWLIEHGPSMVSAAKEALQNEVAATQAPEESQAPLVEEYTPDPALQADTPQPGTPAPTREPTATPTQLITAPPAQDPSAPLYGKIIGIDPCRDSTSKYPDEVANNLELAFALKEFLEQQGATVVLAREENEGVYELEDRAKTFKKAGCHLVVRMMANHISEKTSAAYVYGTGKNEDFCREVLNAYVEKTGMKKQSGKKSGYEKKSDEVCKNCGCPCAVLIVGNWENDTDKMNLQDDSFRLLMMEGIYQGILNYLSK